MPQRRDGNGRTPHWVTAPHGQGVRGQRADLTLRWCVTRSGAPESTTPPKASAATPNHQGRRTHREQGGARTCGPATSSDGVRRLGGGATSGTSSSRA